MKSGTRPRNLEFFYDRIFFLRPFNREQSIHFIYLRLLVFITIKKQSHSFARLSKDLWSFEGFAGSRP